MKTGFICPMENVVGACRATNSPCYPSEKCVERVSAYYAGRYDGQFAVALSEFDAEERSAITAAHKLSITVP